MANLAVIPARGGSKRIPHKNIRNFLGKPIIEYSIDRALSSQLFEEVMVSSDDPEIIAISQQAGAKTPFIRSSEAANDHASLTDVLLEVVGNYNKIGREFQNICLLLPTAPFITIANLRAAYNRLIETQASSIIPVAKFSYPILRALSIGEGEILTMNWPEFKSTRSQDLAPAYHDSGSFYWLKADDFLKEKQIFMEKTAALELNAMQVQDIDTEDDWRIAEMKYKLMASFFLDA